jgi:hypothetical protein
MSQIHIEMNKRSHIRLPMESNRGLLDKSQWNWREELLIALGSKGEINCDQELVNEPFPWFTTVYQSFTSPIRCPPRLKDDESEYKTKAAVEIGCFLIQSIIRPQRHKSLISRFWPQFIYLEFCWKRIQKWTDESWSVAEKEHHQTFEGSH